MKKLLIFIGINILFFVFFLTVTQQSNTSELESTKLNIDEVNTILNNAGVEDFSDRGNNISTEETIQDSLKILSIDEARQLQEYLNNQEKLNRLEEEMLQGAKDKTLLSDSVKRVVKIVSSPVIILILMSGVGMVTLINLPKAE